MSTNIDSHQGRIADTSGAAADALTSEYAKVANTMARYFPAVDQLQASEGPGLPPRSSSSRYLAVTAVAALTSASARAWVISNSVAR